MCRKAVRPWSLATGLFSYSTNNLKRDLDIPSGLSTIHYSSFCCGPTAAETSTICGDRLWIKLHFQEGKSPDVAAYVESAKAALDEAHSQPLGY